MDETRIKLYRILKEHFNDEELRTLCFGLGIEYDDLSGEGRADKARELITYLERRRNVSQLIRIGKQLYPDISWKGTLETIDLFYNQLRKPTIESIDNDKRLINLSRGYWVYDELITTLLRSGWVRFAAGFKAGIYAHPKHHWCIKFLGMGVGDDPAYFCERGYYLEHERNMLIDFKIADCNFQPDVMTQEEAINFLVKECGVPKEQAVIRSKNNDILIMEFFPGIPLLIQTGKHLECEINPCIMNDRVLRDIGTALESLRIQLDEANAHGLLHNDPIGFNIVFTLGLEDKVVAKLVDFELAQSQNRPSPGYVNDSVREQYRERNVPFNSHTNRYSQNLDQQLMGESIRIVEQLAAKLKKLKDPDSPFQSILSVGPFDSGIKIKLKNVIEYLRQDNEI